MTPGLVLYTGFPHGNQHPGGCNQDQVSALQADILDNFNSKSRSQNLLQAPGIATFNFD